VTRPRAWFSPPPPPGRRETKEPNDSKLTDVPEKVIAFYAKKLGIDAIDVIDRLVVRGDNIFLSLRGLADADGHEWAWVRG
jgi:hypothetical protein